MGRKHSRIPIPSALEATYEAAAHRARRRLASRFELENLAVESPDYPGRSLLSESTGVKPTQKAKNGKQKEEKQIEEILAQRWREVWRINIAKELDARCEEIEPRPSALVGSLFVAVPPRFPDELPAVYLSQADFQAVFPIPHLDRNRLLCTYDSAEVIPDCNQGPKLVLAVVERAIGLIIEGLTGANHDDFEEEFSAYWAQECDENKVISIVSVSDQPQDVRIFSVGKSTLWGASYLIAQNEAQATQFLRAIKGSLNAPLGRSLLGRGRPALYLPLPHFGRPPFPTTNRELWDRLGEISAPSQNQLLRFLVKAPRPAAVLFSVPVGEGRTLGLWWHPQWRKAEHKVGGHAGRHHAASVPGFRPNKLSVVQEIKRVAADLPLDRAAVERLDEPRLQSRTLGSASDTSLRVNVVGCGSLGSQLAGALAESGKVGEISLFDPQILGVENVPRHLCDLSSVGHYKTNAVIAEIGKRSPLLRFHSHPRDVLDVLREKPDALQNSDLTLLALGNFAVERRISRLAIQQPELFSSLCFTWIEPLALGGHALWFPQREKARLQPCFECAFNENLLLPQRIVNAPMSFSRREAGCQTTFVPYGGPDLAAFLASLSRFLLQCLDSPPSQPQLWSWAGDLELARRQNFQILNPSSLQSFSAAVLPLSFSPLCPGCSMSK